MTKFTDRLVIAFLDFTTDMILRKNVACPCTSQDGIEAESVSFIKGLPNISFVHEDELDCFNNGPFSTKIDKCNRNEGT